MLVSPRVEQLLQCVRLSYFGKAALLALAYALIIHLNLRLVDTSEHAFPLWLPSGLGMAAILAGGPRYLPALFFGAFFCYFVELDRPVLVSGAIALLSNTLEPMLAWLMLSRFSWGKLRFDLHFTSASDFLLLTFAAAISALLAAIIGCLLLLWTGTIPPLEPVGLIKAWWLGNMAGIVLITPLLMLWRERVFQLPKPQNLLEGLLCFSLAFIMGQGIFLGWGAALTGQLYIYPLFIFIAWAALSFGRHGVTLIIAISAIQALYGATHGVGAFVVEGDGNPLRDASLFLLILAGVGIPLGLVTDDRRRIESSLRDSEERWKFALEGAGDGVWDWDARTNKVFLSRQWKAMLGYAEHEIGDDLSEWENRVHPEDLARCRHDLEQHLKGIVPVYTNEHRILCKDGSYKWILDRGMVIARSENHEPLRVIGTHTDITRQKLYEASIRDNEKILNTIFSSSLDGIMVLDSNHQITHANTALGALFAVKPEELQGQSEHHFSTLLEERCEVSNVQTKNIEIQSGRSEQRILQSAFQIEHPQRRHIVQLTIDIGQEQINKVVYFRDVTAETTINHMKSEFLSTAAHELRTPLSIILGYAELLQKGTFDEATVKRILEVIYRQSHGIINLLNELLDIARIEAGGGKTFKLQEVDPTALLTQVAENFISAGDQRKVVLQPLPELPPLRIDPEKISQAILNCLSNAFKFSDTHTQVVLSAERVEDEGTWVVVQVQDQGVGMSKEQCAHAFDKFYRAESSGSIPGAGLGLALVKEIIEAHQGKVLIRSEPNAGTTIRLMLPVEAGLH